MFRKSNFVLMFFIGFLLSITITEKSKHQNTIETWFNYPKLNPVIPGEVLYMDFLPENKLINLINNASPKSEIYIAIYLFTRPPLAKALTIAATEKNVKIHMIVEDGWPSITQAQKEIIANLEGLKSTDGGKLIRIYKCIKGCHGKVINHNKFFLFSKIGDKKNIVVQSSANMNDATGRLYENTVVIKGDRKLYNGYLQYWYDLSNRDKNANYFRAIEGDNYPLEGSLKVYFFPQKKGDQLFEILSDIDCHNSNTQIRATVSNWDSIRGLDVKLQKLAKQGCDVAVIVPDNHKKTPCDVRVNMYPDVRVYTGYKLPHSKYLIVKGMYKGEKKSIVWTGSHNYSWSSLRLTDDTLLEIIDKDVVKSFVENWKKMRDTSQIEIYSINQKESNSSCNGFFINSQL